VHVSRRFNLVFLLDAFGLPEAEQQLAEALDSVTTEGLLNFLDFPPTVRIPRPRHYKWDFLDFD